MSRVGYPSDKQDQFVLRLPDGMRDEIKKSAAKNGRSMNAEIICRLEDSYQAERSADLNAVLWEVKAHLEATKPMFEELGKRLGLTPRAET